MDRRNSPSAAGAWGRVVAIALTGLLAATAIGAEEFGAPTLLRPPDPALDHYFGAAVAIDGDTLAVGAPFSPEGGVVYVYQRRRHQPNEWALVAMVNGQNPADDERFGSALALEGDTLVVGSPDEDARATHSGIAYVFYRNRRGPNRWGYVRALLPKPLASHSHLGSSVAISGDLAAAGAPGVDTVYVHERNGPIKNWWGLETELQGEITSDEVQRFYGISGTAPEFGRAVSLEGRTLVVGAADTSDGAQHSYGIFIFDRVDDDGKTEWDQLYNFESPALDDGYEDPFGWTLALYGPNVLIGGAEAGTSGCHLYERNYRGTNRWGHRPELTDLVSDVDSVGQVALRGSTAAMAALFRPEELGEYRAGALIFERHQSSRNKWGLVARLSSPDVTETARAVAIGPREVVVGHPYAGVVQVFPRAPIVAADFEDGDTTGMNVARGNVEVVSPGLHDSGYALSVPVDGTGTRSFVRAKQPKRETILSLSFLLSANRVELSDEQVQILRLHTGKDIVLMTLEEHSRTDQYWATLWAREDDKSWREVGQARVPAAKTVELGIEWRAASGPGADNGMARLLRNGKERAHVDDLDNDRLYVNSVMLGLPRGSAGTVGGYFLVDDFEIHR